MWWGTGQLRREHTEPLNPTRIEMSMEQVGTSLGPYSEGLRKLYENHELCDVVLKSGSEVFPAHRAMIASMSTSFRKYLQQLQSTTSGDAPSDLMGGMLSVASSKDQSKNATIVDTSGSAPKSGGELAAKPAEASKIDIEASKGITASATATAQPSGPGTSTDAIVKEESVATPATAAAEAEKVPRILELQVNSVSEPEAVKTLLLYIYHAGTGASWEYQPSSEQVNKDILRLSRHFNLPHLHEHAARWLTKDLTTANVVDRLVTCEDFKLGMLYDKIIQQLTNPTELAMVSSSLELMKHPRILQDLLVQVASLCGANAQGAEKPSEKGEQKTSEEAVAKSDTPPVVEDKAPGMPHEKVGEKVIETEPKKEKEPEKISDAAVERVAEKGAKRALDKGLEPPPKSLQKRSRKAIGGA